MNPLSENWSVRGLDFGNPLVGLGDLWKLKLSVAFAGSGIALFVERLLEYLGVLFDVPPILAIAAVVLVAADFLVGVAAAYMRGTFKLSCIESTGVKVLIYLSLVLVTAVFSNAFQETAFRFATDFLLGGVFLYICSTEWFSILETLFGSKRKTVEIVRRIFRFSKLATSDRADDDFAEMIAPDKREKK